MPDLEGSDPDARGSEGERSFAGRGDGTLPVVALGGSAGGIRALQEFFAAMPADSGMAFVVILPLSPEHESTLAELFQRCTAMPVVTARDGARVEANCVYVIPPGKYLSSAKGGLRLAEAHDPRGKRVAVDVFFRSLAETHGPESVAVVLSGADGDGALGLKRIKECGGLTIAQDPDEAEHSGMPRSAIATGMVDWVLAVKEMPGQLRQYLEQRAKLILPAEDGPHPAPAAAPAPDEHETALREVLAYLHTRTARDFSYYKRATILRRLARRMQVNGLIDLPGYLVYLRTHAGEAGALVQDLLISVTNFFRDPESFAALERVIPELFQGKGPGEAVRVWVAGCATGEEAYSIAMLLGEHARTLDAPPPFQVFATDLDEEVIREAREGLYPTTIATDVSEERLQRFFIHEPGGYRVRREVRESVLFAPHDLLKDSPFSRLDLVSCRNLLIYLNRAAQKRALDIFHFALRPGGRLFLGTSETMDEGSPLFAVTDQKQRLYAQRPGPRQTPSMPTGPSARDLPERPRDGHRRLAPAPELPASNEELQAMNEELRSATEELETSREELQSINEELTTVNEDLKGKIDELARAHSDLQNLMAATAIATVFLDRELRIMRYTPSAVALFNFIPTDLGRPLTDLTSQLDHPEIAADAAQALEHLRPAQREVSAGGHCFLARTLPYRTADDRVAGVVLTFLDITERKQAEEELRQSEARKDAVLQSALDAIVTIDREGNFVEFNPAAEKIFGHARAAVIGRPMAELIIPPRLRERHHRGLAHYLSTGEGPVLNRQIELPALRADGTEFPAELAILPVPGSEPPLFTAFLRDITGRKQAEEAQREVVRLATLRAEISVALVSGEKLGAVLQRCAAALVTHLDAAFARIWTLNAAEDVLELQASAGLYTHLDGPHGRVKMGEFKIGRIARSGQPLLTNDVAHDPNISDPEWARREGMVAFAGYPLLLEGGVLGVVAMFARQPLSAPVLEELAPLAEGLAQWVKRKQAEESLHASEERLRALADAIPQLAWTARADGFIHWYNRRWYEYTGTTERQMEGWGWQSVHDPARLPDVMERWTASIATGEIFEMIFPLRGADGEFRPFLTRSIPLKNAAGKVTQWFGTNTEVSELKRIEQALIEAKESAEAANRSKDRFLAVLSHELRTPLTPVLMAVAALEHDPELRAEVREDMQMIKRNIELETKLIDDLLDLSRITSSKVELRREAVDLNEAVRHVCGICRSQIQEHNVRLETDFAADAGFLSADPARLQQILWNVLKNAVKFTPAQGTVRVSTARLASGRCAVRVRDTGIGIPPEVLPRIFDAFEQGDARITRQFGGLGLGLAITRALVELHDGTIRAESAGAGQGATFIIELPGQSAAPTAAAPVAAPAGHPERAQLRLLLVEDHPDTARTLGRLLRAAGFAVLTAADVAGAIATAEREPLDLLISDLGLPDGSGYDIMRAIRASRPVPGIAMSGYGMEEDVRRSHAAGFTEHLVKPVEVPHLIAAIRRVTENRG